MAMVVVFGIDRIGSGGRGDGTIRRCGGRRGRVGTRELLHECTWGENGVEAPGEGLRVLAPSGLGPCAAASRRSRWDEGRVPVERMCTQWRCA